MIKKKKNFRINLSWWLWRKRINLTSWLKVSKGQKELNFFGLGVQVRAKEVKPTTQEGRAWGSKAHVKEAWAQYVS